MTMGDGRRIRSIQWVHDGERCFAEVGGDVTFRTPIRKRRKARYESPEFGPPQPSGVTVEAIEVGTPYFVRLKPPARGRWNNPIYIGESSIGRVDYFDDDSPERSNPA
jgi:hypothetical protein